MLGGEMEGGLGIWIMEWFVQSGSTAGCMERRMAVTKMQVSVYVSGLAASLVFGDPFLPPSCSPSLSLSLEPGPSLNSLTPLVSFSRLANKDVIITDHSFQVPGRTIVSSTANQRSKREGGLISVVLVRQAGQPDDAN